LEIQTARRADAFARDNAGRRSAAKMEMMLMTTSSSSSVNALHAAREDRCRDAVLADHELPGFGVI
jgi:hypothetical protein